MADVSYTNEVVMRKQFLKEKWLVDLNCGKYCTESAAKWVQSRHNLSGTTDIFHDVLPPTQGIVGWGWSPEKEGKDVTTGLAIPDNANTWKFSLTAHGPLVVSVRILAVFGHFVLVTGCVGDTIEYKDPLEGDVALTMSCAAFGKSIIGNEVFAVRKLALRDKLKTAPITTTNNRNVELP